MLNVRTGNFGFAACVALVACAAAAPAQATDPVAKWCTGVKIAAFPGGPQGGVFANNVYNGFKQAELDLGPTVTYYFSDWDPNKMLTQIQQALATKVDGIATYGFGGEAATGADGRSGLRAGHDLHHPQHVAPREPEEIFGQGLRLCRRAQLFRRLCTRRRSGEARQAQARRQRFRLGPQGPGRRSRPAHRGRDRRLHQGGSENNLSGDRCGDQRRSERRHRDLRRRDGRQSRDQDRRD